MKQVKIEFVCKKCKATNTLRKRTFNAQFTEYISVTNDGQLWDICDVQLEIEGDIQFYCDDCGAVVEGVHDECEMSEWIIKNQGGNQTSLAT
ncbi:MAG: hypothetical protein GY869_15235 [Planctomycetes bacterium]|nr:hypothetical protein [Planctomycetota bacterium]